MTVTVRCPAKVNLFLAVGPPDARGYHPLRTVFQAIGLYDELEISREGQGVSFECDWPGMPEENTVTKAVRLISELYDLAPLRIRLTKRVPVQAGLGGGSSDAAGLLRGIRRVLPVQLPEGFEQDVATAVGADVPFFLVGGCARAEGYGERLTALDAHLEGWVAVMCPPLGVSTAQAYRDLDTKRFVWRDWPENPLEPRSFYNDFERVAPCECLDLIERLESHGAQRALLCGSGSAVFGLFDRREDAERAAEAVKHETEAEAWIAPTLSRAESLWTS